ncbi:MBL fold metallo-hydrolase [Oscillospiraceae bacterium MB08-C2-2]|nr:MBL fold metallo-hydrolase [Oscillospiraceae bacterium MB08-C2-2]
MSRFCPLFSSSGGNCTYLSGGSTRLLVDAGVSCRSILSALEQISVDPATLSGILLTHEHIDHIKGLKVLLKKIKVPVFASCGTLDYLVSQDLIPPGAQLVELEQALVVGDIRVTPFATPHDCAQSLGFRLEMPDERVIGIATDLGHITETVASHLERCDLIMLESNYDEGMLQCSPYPYHLKRRIQSSVGHLSNPECARQLQGLVQRGSVHLVLAHLSSQNNMPAVAHATTKCQLEMAGMTENVDYTLCVAPRNGPGQPIIF